MCFQPGEILGRGDFQIALCAFGDGHVKTCGAGHFDVVSSGAFKGAMGGENGGKVKALRSLRAVKSVAVLGACHGVGIAAPERVGDGQGRRGTGCAGA